MTTPRTIDLGIERITGPFETRREANKHAKNHGRHVRKLEHLDDDPSIRVRAGIYYSW